MDTALSQMFLLTSKVRRNLTITFLLKATIVTNLDKKEAQKSFYKSRDSSVI